MSDLWGLHTAADEQAANSAQQLYRGMRINHYDIMDTDLDLYYELDDWMDGRGDLSPSAGHRLLNYIQGASHHENGGAGLSWSTEPLVAEKAASLWWQNRQGDLRLIMQADHPGDHHVDHNGPGALDKSTGIGGEAEVRMLPGAPMSVNSIRIAGPSHGRNFTEALSVPNHQVTASTDGIRYAHIVEADVAEDLIRLAMPAPMPEGITFHHHPTNDTIPTDPFPATRPPHEKVPRFSAPAVEARHNGETVGYLEWDPPLHATVVNGIQYGDHPPEVSMIKVDPDYRRHGIATALFDFARQHQGDLEHSDSRTGLGNLWVDYEQSRSRALARLAMPTYYHYTYDPNFKPWNYYGDPSTAGHDGRPVNEMGRRLASASMVDSPDQVLQDWVEKRDNTWQNGYVPRLNGDKCPTCRGVGYTGYSSNAPPSTGNTCKNCYGLGRVRKNTLDEGGEHVIKPFANRLESALYQDFMNWWPTSQAAQTRTPEDSHTGWAKHPNEPITHWLNVEDYLSERHPQSATGGKYGLESAGQMLHRLYNDNPATPDELDRWGYLGHGDVITQAMLNLHNRLQGREHNNDQDRRRYYELMLRHVGPAATRLSRLVTSMQRTAMPQPLPKGVYFRYHPELMWSPGVTAHAPGGQQIGSLEWYDDDHIMVELGTRRPGEIDRIGVHPDHQGRSIATSMFDFAKRYEPRLHHSEELTEDGRGWSEYERSRNARLAMAWQDWESQIQHAYESPEGLPFSVGKYHITHGDGAESSLSYLHRPERKLLQVQVLGTEEPHQRQGIAEAFLRRLHADYPDHRIDPSGMTDDGQAFHDRMLSKEPDARSILAGRNGDPPPMTFEPFNTMWSNGIMARHAEDGRPLAHLHWYPDGEIESIRVHPEMQGRDIGKHILAHAVMNPDTYEAPHWGIQPSNHMTEAGRAYARSLGYNPPDEEVTAADNDVSRWGWTAVRDYVPLSVPYTGQNEEEMKKHLDNEWTPPAPKTASTEDEGWPVWWRGRHRPAGPFDKRWHPNHPEHVPAPWAD